MGPPPAAGWGLVVLRAHVPWDVAARPPLGGASVFGAAEVGAVVTTDRGGPVVTDATAAGFLGAPSHDPLSAALTSVAAALTWLASTPPAPALVRAHLDLAAMVLAGVVDPTTCVYASDDTVAWPASRGVARLAAHVARAWRAERERRGGRLYLVATDECEGRPYAERAAALAFYGRMGAVGGVMPAPWVDAAPSTQLPPAGEHCPVCLADFTDEWPSPDPNSRAPPGRWADGAVRCQHALCRDCDLGVQRASRDVRRRCPECRRARRSVIAAPP